MQTSYNGNILYEGPDDEGEHDYLIHTTCGSRFDHTMKHGQPPDHEFCPVCKQEIFYPSGASW